MSFAVGSLGGKVKLHEGVDNWAGLDYLVDTDPHVTLPAGEWFISRGLNISGTLQGQGVTQTTLRQTGSHGSPTIGAGGNGRWAGSEGHMPVDGVRIFGLTVWQDDHSAPGNSSAIFINDECNDIIVRNVRVQNSAYEGIVVGALCGDVLIENFEAFDCGGGSALDTRARAGINAVSHDTIIQDFVVRGCGQGVEAGYSDVVIRRGLVTEPDGAMPSYGLNIGSHSCGVYNLSIDRVKVNGYENSAVIGNVLGRLARVIVTACEFDGCVTFYGGKHDNNIPTAEQGPDTYGSEFVGNTWYVRTPNAGPFVYYGGTVDDGGLYGREPLLLQSNKVYYGGGWRPNPPTWGFAGKIPASIEMRDNVEFGLDLGPERGSIASFTLQANPAIPGMPNLVLRNNWGHKADGSFRGLIVMRE